ncbi:hypothetical protein C8J57DRAFT_1714342 [Mycena rebaudengoi]|nr:hypothetical protein C8J57DRAFT_1714342 [Mycena rebaudengoi]
MADHVGSSPAFTTAFVVEATFALLAGSEWAGYFSSKLAPIHTRCTAAGRVTLSFAAPSSLLLIAASFTEGAEDKKTITRLAAALTFSNVQRIWSVDLTVSPPGR